VCTQHSYTNLAVKHYPQKRKYYTRINIGGIRCVVHIYLCNTYLYITYNTASTRESFISRLVYKRTNEKNFDFRFILQYEPFPRRRKSSTLETLLYYYYSPSPSFLFWAFRGLQFCRVFVRSSIIRYLLCNNNAQ